MATVFWDRKGVVLVEFMPKDYTNNAEEYCNTLKKLRRNIENRRRGMLSRGVSLLQHGADFSGTAHYIWTGKSSPSDFHLFIEGVSTTRPYKSWSPDYKNASNSKAIVLKNSLLYL